MDWARYAEVAWIPFMTAYYVFLIVAARSCVLQHIGGRASIRDWIGTVGFAAASVSAILYFANAAARIHWHKLIADGAALWTYYLTGELLGLLGFLLGSAGRGKVRFFSLVASIVMIFQWIGAMTYGRRTEAFIANVTYFSVLVVVSLSAASWIFGRWARSR